MSNTYLLETKYDWKGICSEPLPSAYIKLKKCRNVICDNQAVFSKSNLDLNFSESNLYSGITNYIDKHTDKLKPGNTIIVKTITLQELLDKYNAPNVIHYFSLDTEGTELEILKSVDFSKYKFLYINLEHNNIEPRRSDMKKLLLDNGYLYKGANKWDDDYIHESVLTGTYYQDNDYTKPIIIKKINENKFIVTSPYWKDTVAIYKKSKLHCKDLKLNKGIISYNQITYDNGIIWHRKF